MPSNNNIAIYIDSLAGGGAERVMLSLAEELCALGNRVHFFLLEDVIDYVPDDSIKTHVLPTTGKRTTITNVFNVKKTAKDMESLVHSVEKAIGKFDLHLANLDSTNQVINHCSFNNVYYVIHNSVNQELNTAKRRNPFRYMRTKREKRILTGKHLIAVSQGVADEIVKGDLIKPASIHTIYNPCDINKIRSLSEQQNEQIPNFPYLIHIGRVVRQKRHDVLFKALKDIPDIKLVLLCKNVKKVRKLAQKMGVADRIITPAFQENPYNWIKNAKLMVFSSDFEGLGMVLIESLICGTPVVSTDCDFGPSEILTHDLANFLVPTNDPKRLAQKVNEALESDIDVNDAAIINKVQLSKIAQQYLSLIKH
mgnify:CR=1 FL=1